MFLVCQLIVWPSQVSPGFSCWLDWPRRVQYEGGTYTHAPCGKNSNLIDPFGTKWLLEQALSSVGHRRLASQNDRCTAPSNMNWRSWQATLDLGVNQEEIFCTQQAKWLSTFWSYPTVCMILLCSNSNLIEVVKFSWPWCHLSFQLIISVNRSAFLW